MFKLDNYDFERLQRADNKKLIKLYDELFDAQSCPKKDISASELQACRCRLNIVTLARMEGKA